MKIILVLTFITIIFLSAFVFQKHFLKEQKTNAKFQNDFLAEQKSYERVQTAFSEKEETVEKTLKKNGIKPEELNILLLAFKTEQRMDIYAKKTSESTYKKILTYPICDSSGKLGPKRKLGDYQVPEGFYHIDRFNPESSYFLLLGINYPNESDKKKTKAKNAGKDIFIQSRF